MSDYDDFSYNYDETDYELTNDLLKEEQYREELSNMRAGGFNPNFQISRPSNTQQSDITTSGQVISIAPPTPGQVSSIAPPTPGQVSSIAPPTPSQVSSFLIPFSSQPIPGQVSSFLIPFSSQPTPGQVSSIAQPTPGIKTDYFSGVSTTQEGQGSSYVKPRVYQYPVVASAPQALSQSASAQPTITLNIQPASAQPTITLNIQDMVERVTKLLNKDQFETNDHWNYRRNYTIQTANVFTSQSVPDQLVLAIGRAKTNKIYKSVNYPVALQQYITYVDSTLS